MPKKKEWVNQGNIHLFFFNSEGIVHKEFVSQGQTVIWTFYCIWVYVTFFFCWSCKFWNDVISKLLAIFRKLQQTSWMQYQLSIATMIGSNVFGKGITALKGITFISIFKNIKTISLILATPCRLYYIIILHSIL